MDSRPVPKRNEYYTEFPIKQAGSRGRSGVGIYSSKNDPHAARDCAPNTDPSSDPNLESMYNRGSNVFIRDSTSVEAINCV